jgi:hypothetical protein
MINIMEINFRNLIVVVVGYRSLSMKKMIAK